MKTTQVVIIMYKSTRSKKLYTSSEAILNGLADDGGLFIPESINNIDFNIFFSFIK